MGALDGALTYCRCTSMSPTTKDDRLQIRVAPERERVLEEAAETSHLSVSAFVLQAAEMHADKILFEHQMVRLAPDAGRAFATARRASVGQRAPLPGARATALVLAA